MQPQRVGFASVICSRPIPISCVALDFNGFGPKIGADFVGGTTYFNASAEVQFPMPLIPESIGVKGAVFADAGYLVWFRIYRSDE